MTQVYQCKATDCRFNINGQCSQGIVTIDADCLCDDFEEKE